VSQPTGRAVVTGAAGVALAALALGCGAEPRPADPATLEAGARVFREAGCGTCHTLSAAGSGGRIGPSLDRRRLGPDAIAAQVRDGGGGMPAFDGRLSEGQIDALAAYVAEVGGR
jgi:mono/diheme cytochrome c family protein